MATTASTTDPKPELGVLFVHGIGQQRPGQTLAKFADPLSRWLARWLSDGHHTEADVERRDGAHVVVSGTLLGPADEPARLQLAVAAGTTLTRDGERRWLLAESCWAEAFEPPKTASLLMWMLVILPYVVLIQTWEKIRRARRATQPGARGELTRAARIVAFLFVYLSALPLAALGAVVIALLLIGLVVPIPQVGDRAKKLALILSNTVGDSFVLTSSAVQFDAMVTRVESDLRWLAERVQRVAVVAHSQGTAVSYAALTGREPPENLHAFVTLGEAIKKLQLVRALQSYGPPRPALPGFERHRLGSTIASSVGRWLKLKSLRFTFGWVGLLGIFLLGYAVPQLVFALAHAHRHIAWPAAVAGLGLVASFGSLLVCATCWSDDFERKPEAVVARGRRVRWADFFASADPVPNGPLFRDLAEQPWVSETEVWNYASILRDHTSYTKREDGFLSDLVRVLSEAGGQPLSAEADALLRHGRWRGWWRVWWLTFARSLAAAGAIATVYRLWGHLRTIGAHVTGWPHWWGPLRWLGHRLVLALEKLIIVGNPAHAQIAGALVVLTVIAGGYLLLSAVWAYWQKQDVKRFYQRTTIEADTDPLGGRELLWFLFTLALLTLVGVVADISGDYGTPWHWSTDRLWISGLVLLGLVVAPIFLAARLRGPLHRLEAGLMAMFPRDPEVQTASGSAAAPEAPPVAAS